MANKKNITILVSSFERVNLLKDTKNKVVQTGVIEDNVMYYIEHVYKEENGCVTVIK